MDRHTVNLNDTGLRFLSLKPPLLKYTISAMEITTEYKSDSQIEVPQIQPSASARIKK